MIIAKITIKNNRFALIESRSENLQEIGEIFTYGDQSACWVRGKYRKENIKYVKFLVTSKKTPTSALLPIGFLNELIQYLDKVSAKYKVEDTRSSQVWTFSDDDIKNSLGYLTLYDYQIEAVRACIDKKVGVCKSATGSGKCCAGDTEIEIEYDDEKIQF